MKLGELSHGIGSLVKPESGSIEINHITHDSRKVQHGSLFVAIEGAHNDGHEYIACASQLGAVCICTDQREKIPCNIPVLAVTEPRVAMARLARRLYDYPDKKLKVVGLTGTNGKTTGTYLLQQLLGPLGKVGRIGTLSYYNGVSEEKATRTTPEACDLYRCLCEMVSNGCTYTAIEISSHGLVLNRVRDLNIHYALFSNLTRDHLDFHENMEDYFAAKQKLFDHLVEGGTAIINWDDDYARRLKIPDHARLIRVGTSEACELRFTIDALSVTGSRFTVDYLGTRQSFEIPMLGQYNVYNFCAAMAVALCEGRELADIAGHCQNLNAVPGRGEMLNLGQNFGVMIDFAHTPDAMKNVLASCRNITKGRLISVFGAGGDRDHSKRSEMGKMAHTYADVILLTSDNPRTEDPEAIMDMIATGIEREVGPTYQRQWDRARAIEEAVNMAQEGDLVLISGKGHETSQEIGRNFQPFDDRLVAAQFIQKRLGIRNG